MFKPPYPVLAEDRVRWVGDPVAFVVAETAAQAQDAAELVAGRLRATAGGRLHRRGGRSPAPPNVWDELRRQYLLRRADRRQGRDRRRLRQGRARRQAPLRHQPRDRGGDGAARRGRRLSAGGGPLHHPHAGAARAPLSQRNRARCSRSPESKVRVICIDVGGSFGMKTPVFNEAPLALFASKLTGRPVKWMSTRTEAFLSDAQARDNVTEAELALDKDGHFLAMRVKTIAAIGAYLQNNMPAFILNAGTLAGAYRTPAMLRRHHRRVHQYQSGAPLSRQRPPGSRLRHRAHGRSRRRRTRHRSGRVAPAQLHFAQPDAVQDRADVHLRLRRIRKEHGSGAGAGRLQGLQEAARGVAQARQTARLRHLQHHRARRRRRHRRRRSALRPRRHRDLVFRLGDRRPGPRNRVQATGLRPARPQSGRGALRAGRHRRGVLRRRHRRLAHVDHVERGVSRWQPTR